MNKFNNEMPPVCWLAESNAVPSDDRSWFATYHTFESIETPSEKVSIETSSVIELTEDEGLYLYNTLSAAARSRRIEALANDPLLAAEYERLANDMS